MATVSTRSSDEEIRSFITIFRRLYMTNDDYTFAKAVECFCKILSQYPIANYVKGGFDVYSKDLNAPPSLIPPMLLKNASFTRKHLIDVFLYTQYAHQPSEKRIREFEECLKATQGNRQKLTWIFLTQIWHCAIQIRNAGIQIKKFVEHYQALNKRTAIIESLQSDHSLGTLEKKAARRERILTEGSAKLAHELWEQNGRPEGGSSRFVEDAMKLLKESL